MKQVPLVEQPVCACIADETSAAGACTLPPTPTKSHTTHTHTPLPSTHYSYTTNGTHSYTFTPLHTHTHPATTHQLMTCFNRVFYGPQSMPFSHDVAPMGGTQSRVCKCKLKGQ